MASQKELANRLNVTQSTISRALNDDQSLPVETILKVKKLAMHLGYKPRRYTKYAEHNSTHINNKSKKLLILINGKVSGKIDNLVVDMVQGFIQATKDADIEFVVKKINNLQDAKRIVNTFSNNTVGCVTIYRFDDDIIKFLNSNFPCLSVNHRYDNLDIKTIDVEQELAFSDMYKYLYDKGHRNIGFLTVENSNHLIFRRIAGFFRGAKHVGNPVNNDWIFNVHANDNLNSDELVEKIIELNKKENVTAFICTSGGFAEILISKLRKKDIKIPEDISFGAFDELFTPLNSGVSLFGGQSDYREMSQVIINIFKNFELFEKISNISIPATLFYGNSVHALDNQNIDSY